MERTFSRKEIWTSPLLTFGISMESKKHVSSSCIVTLLVLSSSKRGYAGDRDAKVVSSVLPMDLRSVLVELRELSNILIGKALVLQIHIVENSTKRNGAKAKRYWYSKFKIV